MAMYKTCEHCGSNLDHGESCDCGGIITMPPVPKKVKEKHTMKSRPARRRRVNLYATRHTCSVKY
jgi:hypothetical protein